jgi:hypothetical protein
MERQTRNVNQAPAPAEPDLEPMRTARVAHGRSVRIPIVSRTGAIVGEHKAVTVGESVWQAQVRLSRCPRPRSIG